MSETIRGSGKWRLKWDFQAKKWRWNYLGLILASAFRLEMVTELQNMTAQPGWNTWLSVFSTLGFRVECSQWALLSSRFPQSQSQHPSSAMKVLVMKDRFLILFFLLLLLCCLRMCWGLMGLLWAINNPGWARWQGESGLYQLWCHPLVQAWLLYNFPMYAISPESSASSQRIHGQSGEGSSVLWLCRQGLSCTRAAACKAAICFAWISLPRECFKPSQGDLN